MSAHPARPGGICVCTFAFLRRDSWGDDLPAPVPGAVRTGNRAGDANLGREAGQHREETPRMILTVAAPEVHAFDSVTTMTGILISADLV